jgi:hypothetical protein
VRRLTGVETVTKGPKATYCHQGTKHNSTEFTNHNTTKVEGDGIGRGNDFGRKSDKIGTVGEDEQDKDD